MGLLHIRYVFDTGASHTLSPTQVHGSLRSSGPSRLEIIGYHGSNTQFGKSSGILSGCAVGSEIPFTFGPDTTKDLNDFLFTFTDMYERQNFCLSLTQQQWKVSVWLQQDIMIAWLTRSTQHSEPISCTAEQTMLSAARSQAGTRSIGTSASSPGPSIISGASSGPAVRSTLVHHNDCARPFWVVSTDSIF